MEKAGLSSLFAPASVAIFGASSDPNKIGGRPLSFLLKAGYQGSLYPVNPKVDVVQGVAAYPSIDAIEGDIEAAIIALPAKLVVETVDACLARGVKAIILFTAGFGEISEAGKALQQDLADRVVAAGARLLGPNSLGAFSTVSGFFPTFATALDHALPKKGRVGMASQSGAFGSYCYALAEDRGVAFSHFAATGNEADIDVADVVDFYARDPDTDIIMVAIEGAKDGARLKKALIAARDHKKPVIVMKTGTSEAGQTAAATHTGSLAGADRVYDAVFEECGAYRAHSLEDFVDSAYAASVGSYPTKGDVGVITTSGGIGVLIADAVEHCGLSLSALSETAIADIRELLPMSSGINPLDSSTQILGDMSLFNKTFDIMLDQGGYDITLVYLAHIGRNPDHFGTIKEGLIALKKTYPDRLFVICMLTTEEEIADLGRLGFLVFDEPIRAVKAASALVHFGRTFGKDRPAAAVTESQIRLEGHYSEHAAASLLADAGLSMPPTQAVTTADQAVEAARSVGYPVVMKILSADILHKSDIGGVALNISDDETVRATFERIMTAAKTHHPDAVLDGILVAKMMTGGVEAVMGVHKDPVFGPIVMFGLGGIFVEIFEDVVFRTAPFGLAEARSMIERIRGAALLKGARGTEAVDLEAAARALAALSQFAAQSSETLESLDINPILLRPDGAWGLDAVIVGKTE